MNINETWANSNKMWKCNQSLWQRMYEIYNTDFEMPCVWVGVTNCVQFFKSLYSNKLIF